MARPTSCHSLGCGVPRCAEGGCDVAFGAYCEVVGGKHELVAMLERGGTVHAARVNGPNPGALGAAVWSKLDTGART